MKSIIIGSGILGASTAYHLAKEGADVTIIDRQEPGQATDAAAGIVCPWLSQRRNKVWYRLAKGGAKYYPELIHQLMKDGETETGYKQVGAISLHTDEAKLDKMIERAIKRREDAPEIGEIKKLSAEETKKLFPPIDPDYQSVFVSGAARVNGSALRKSLLQSAEKYGAKIRIGDAKLIHSGKRVTGVTIGNDRIEADQVIMTAGVWAQELVAPLGMHFNVTSQKAQIVHLEIANQVTDEWPVVMPPNDQYLLSFDNGRVVVGATHENAVGFDYRVTAGGLAEIFSKALAVAPGLANSTVLDTKVGFRPFTPGFLPVFGHVPEVEGLLAANGLGASGLTVGPYLGLEMARLALGKETDLDPADYDISAALNIN
ncbi:NAD(P)/FAD-dependent oxidoreductase [Guptibacillus hwajinpoensis]|uniref:D-amino-acid dehydrogenase n=1 Tax=Guptibacillus hwajinpoensis TaxID=208199 RepID=A0ABU0K0T9_9BACL|nr:FAD-binding oxidoreductase [Alkalihalobacillus hemicentroti]MDQ0482048.1 D-amino-acid dehydrogenase [Alkalihalobacillus hemicentroti]